MALGKNIWLLSPYVFHPELGISLHVPTISSQNPTYSLGEICGDTTRFELSNSRFPVHHTSFYSLKCRKQRISLYHGMRKEFYPKTQLCIITPRDPALDIDGSVPRKRGGSWETFKAGPCGNINVKDWIWTQKKDVEPVLAYISGGPYVEGYQCYLVPCIT